MKSAISPYCNTNLSATVSLHPKHINKYVRTNIKKELVKSLSRKCYKDHGYLVHIHDILTCSDGVVVNEDPNCMTNYNVDFSCVLCMPIMGTNIISKIVIVSDAFIRADNGPIVIIIMPEQYNTDNFFLDNNKVLSSHIGQGKVVPLQKNNFVKVTIISVAMNSNDDHITVIGFLDSLATDDEIDRYGDNKWFSD